MRQISTVFLGFFCALSLAWSGQGRYMDDASFFEAALSSPQPEQGVLWITPELRERIESVVGHRYPRLRARYWRNGDTTAWILDEVGKEEPITIGISIKARRVAMVRVLEFRESRGWEVRYPFFTDQFHGAALADSNEIDRDIDGITGATLSVAAVSRAVRLALLLDEEVSASADEVTAVASRD
jgi:hypothetical protein